MAFIEQDTDQLLVDGNNTRSSITFEPLNAAGNERSESIIGGPEKRIAIRFSPAFYGAVESRISNTLKRLVANLEGLADEKVSLRTLRIPTIQISSTERLQRTEGWEY